MVLKIGDILKKLRMERSLTQEEMAEHLGVSFQTISKWERGAGYPDITMLPVLARYFNITIDELLGMNDSDKVKTLYQINCKWEENNKNSFHYENIELMRSALKKFPNDARLMVQLSTSLQKMDGTDMQKKRYLQESIALEEQILKYTDDAEVQGATRFNICFSYWKNGDYEKAIEQARRLPNLYKTQENALVYFLEGEEKLKVSKEALEALIWSLSLHISVLTETEKKDARLRKLTRALDILLEENEYIKSI